MTKLEPTEAQRKAMVTAIWGSDTADAERLIDLAIAAANSIPEGPPVGTTKLAPNGVQRFLMAEAAADAAGGWSSDPEDWLPIVDAQISAANRVDDIPVGTIARRPDGKVLAVRIRVDEGFWRRDIWYYIAPQDPEILADEPIDDYDADPWPVIYDPTKPIAQEITSETSDGHHTFGELYHYRMLYNALLFNEWAAQGRYGVHKSKRHSDGEECFGGGWFIVSAQLPHGQVTNHYKLEFWDLFLLPEREVAAEWDGHTPQLVAERLEGCLRALIKLSDPTAQQEPGESLSRGLDDIAAGRVSRRDDYLEPQQEPECPGPPSNAHIKFPKAPRTPRVVDRLGVDEQGSRWRNRHGHKYEFYDGVWYLSGVSIGPADCWTMAPYTEIREPRVLPSLDCEEARDGTVWKARYVLIDDREQTPGWKFRHTADGWVYEDDGTRVMSPEFLADRGPYTEVMS